MFNSPPKVTVLISTYNRPDDLKDSIRSVVNQTMTDWELIVMNDGGVDVADIVAGFHDDRIRYIPDDINRGIAHRLNVGLREARGRYIAYNGDDDRFYPHHLETLHNALEANPGAEVAYANPYYVRFARDEATRERFPLEKQVIVSRRFNRNLMFTINVAAHGCLMHTRELALKVGGYDESVRVLVDWDLTRKMCFFTDFIYVPELTMEGWFPWEKSDRISDRERADPENFQRNTRRIMADLPPGPWLYVKKLAVVYPVAVWTDDEARRITGFIDSLCYPHRFVIVNLAGSAGESRAGALIGDILDLKNVELLTPETDIGPGEARRYAAERVDADYLYLPSDAAVTQLQARLFAGLDLMERSGAEVVNWDTDAEQGTDFDILIKKGFYLEASGQDGLGARKNPGILTARGIPADFEIDSLVSRMREEIDKRAFAEAYRLYNRLSDITGGDHVDSVIMDTIFNLLMCLEKYGQAEAKCRDLIRRGFGADNYIRLGRVLQKTGKTEDAILAYSNGLHATGLEPEHLQSSIFPLALKHEPHCYKAILGMAECYIDVRNFDMAANMLKFASQVMASNYRTALGYARLFLAMGQDEKAESLLTRLVKAHGDDEELLEHLGGLHERRNDLDAAYHCYERSFSLAMNLDAGRKLYRVGSALGRWAGMQPLFEEYAAACPLHAQSAAWLGMIGYQVMDYRRAEFWLGEGLKLDAGFPLLLQLKQLLEQRPAGLASGGGPDGMAVTGPGFDFILPESVLTPGN